MTVHRILVAGCGYLGSALAVRLAGERHLVWALRRNARELPKNVTRFEGDLLVPNTLRHVPDVDFVFYLATTHDGASARAVHVDGLRYLLAALAARRVRVKRLIVGSCLDVYGARDGRWVDEASPAEPTSTSGRAVHESERVAAETGSRCPITVVRLGEIYGPGRLGALDPLLHNASLTPADVRWTNLIHRDDAAGALCHLIGLRRPAPLYVAVDREPIERPALAGWLAEQLGRPAPAIDASRASAPPPESGPSNVRALSELLVESGYNFVYPTYREGYRTTLGQLRDHARRP